MIAIAAPLGRDAQVILASLSPHGIACRIMESAQELFSGIVDGSLAGAIIAEEGFASIHSAALQRAIDDQPPWSDFPFVILTFKGSGPRTGAFSLDRLGNVSLLERPLHPAALITAARGMLRSRARQREVQQFLSQRLEANANLQAFNNLKNLFEKAPGFLAVTHGPDHRFQMANEACRALVARSVVGRTVAEALPEVIDQGVVEILDRVYRTGEPFVAREFPMQLRGETGEMRQHFLTLVYQPIVNADGEVSGLLAEGFDATEQRSAQDKVLLLQNELIHMSRLSAMGAMASTLSHELNQPLMAITNYLRGSNILIDNDGPAALGEIAEAIRKAEKSALRAGDVIRRAREMVVRGSVQQESFELASLVREAVELATVGSASQRLVCRTIYADGLYVFADRIQVQQVVVNLVRNAIEAMAGCRRRELEVITRRAGDMAEVIVADTGNGLDPSVRGELFKPFVSSKEEGMGVGLSISRTIVEGHGGTISADDQPGGGTIFRFTLRIDPSAPSVRA